MSNKTVNVKCPKCGQRFRGEAQELCFFNNFPTESSCVEVFQCLECGVFIVQLVTYNDMDNLLGESDEAYRYTLWPEDETHVVIPDGVPDTIAKDFREAVLVLKISANGSACLSRRCLQSMLRTANASMKKGRLVDEIKHVVEKASDMLPSHLKKQLDHVREIGNFGAHEEKDVDSFDIIDVDKGEAEYLISILRSLMDFYFVQPMEAEKRDRLLTDKKKRAGKKKN